MDRIPMPAALLACRLRSSLGCQKQVGIGHRGRSAPAKKPRQQRFSPLLPEFLLS